MLLVAGNDVIHVVQLTLRRLPCRQQRSEPQCFLSQRFSQFLRLATDLFQPLQ